MDDRGYSSRIVRANELADPKNIGVLLGRICIKKEFPVAVVAEHLGVSRMTIYNWFSGRMKPRSSMVPKIQDMLDRFSDEQGGENG
jgi:transcriptional regulator with XRE-family HTH domain